MRFTEAWPLFAVNDKLIYCGKFMLKIAIVLLHIDHAISYIKIVY